MKKAYLFVIGAWKVEKKCSKQNENTETYEPIGCYSYIYALKGRDELIGERHVCNIYKLLLKINIYLYFQRMPKMYHRMRQTVF